MKIRFTMNCRACYGAEIEIPEDIYNGGDEVVADYINEHNNEIVPYNTWEHNEEMSLFWLEDELITVEDLSTKELICPI